VAEGNIVRENFHDLSVLQCGQLRGRAVRCPVGIKANTYYEPSSWYSILNAIYTKSSVIYLNNDDKKVLKSIKALLNLCIVYGAFFS